MPNRTRAFEAAIAEPWAITEAGLELVLSVANRENSVSVEALEAYRAKHVPTAERLTQRGSVAIIEARGPMFRHANIFTAISGATSYDVMRRDLQAALDDPATRAIVLSLDTPGGVVNGVNELAEAIHAGRQQKPIVAYVGGMAASAGYWLASQASEIVIEATAALGSIGVVATVTDTSKRDAENGRLEFVSSQSPGKRTDLSSDDGKARIQRQVDALAEVFINTVAQGRGVKPDAVISRFGGGEVLIGAAAVAAGMADRIGSFEAVIAELAAGKVPAPNSKPAGQNRRASMPEDNTITKAEHEAAVAKAREESRAEGIASERARVSAILSLDEAKGREASARHLALTTDLTADAAKGVLAGLEVPAAAAAPAPQAEAEQPSAAEALAGIISSEPGKQPASGADKAKAMWGQTIAAINGKNRAAH